MPDFERFNIIVVIPCYRVEREIGAVLAAVPGYIRHILVIDDASPDRTSEIVAGAAQSDPRIELIRHSKNLGVGGAMKTGFARALKLGAQVVIKLDGDGQMDAAHLPDLLIPLLKGQADYSKGNRFRDFQALQKMPVMRRIGNMGLGFLSKAATGYWNLFDPTNGYVAIRAEVLSQIPLERIDNTYFFETSMLANLYLLGALVKDVPMPARYRGEISNLSIRRILLEFPLKLLKTLARRIVIKNLIYDFSMESIYLLAGLPLLLFGVVFGSLKWVSYARQAIPAPTGTVMLATLSVLLGIQFLIAAIEIDIRSTPQEPLSGALSE
ncbi:MAG: glycosyltransferase family 2 protein [Anaerolineales bacterium]|jgi:glycosyltransferase involved in cell wall biosynthesis|nr:glycosyltransferase family 2 protein [Anaerolineales bacterium]